mgnify:FL=1
MAKKRKQGFTLVELLVAMVAATILLGAVVRLILASQKLWLGAAGGSQHYQKTIASFEDLGASVRSASGLVKNASDQRQLVLITSTGSNCRWWFEGNKLWRQESGGAAEVVLGNLSEGNFAYWSDKLGERSTPPHSGGYSVLINVSWSGGSLKTGFFIREWR